MKKLVLPILLSLSLCSCGIFTPLTDSQKANRHVRKAYDHLEKAKKLDPSIESIVKVDTVKVPIVTKETKLDTLVVAKPADTVYLEKDNLRIKIVRLPSDTLYVEGEVKKDTVFVKVPVKESVVIKQESYKSAVKRILGLTELEFWLLHLFILLFLCVIVFAKFIRPKLVVKN